MTRLSTLTSSALLIALLTPGVASAQQYIHASSPATWTPIATVPGMGTVNTITFPSADDNAVSSLPIGFSFNFLGNTYTTFGVSTNGLVQFTQPASTTLSNQTPGTTTTPDNWIAPVWDDLIVSAASGAGKYGVAGTAPDRILVIEVDGFGRYSSSTGGRWQVWLYEGLSGRFDIRVDGSPANASSFNFTMGYEGLGGTPNHDFLGCGSTCSSTDYTSAVGMVYSAFISNSPELTGEITAGTWPRGAFPGDNATGDFELRNQGTQPASNVQVDFYLSSDATLDAGDFLAGSAVVANVPPGNIAVTASATITVPMTVQAADYRLIMDIDPANTIVEAVETDNEIAADFNFATAYDVEPSEIIAPSGGNPGDSVAFNVTITNNGVPFSGALAVDIYASTDQIYDATDTLVGSTSLNLSGQNIESTSVNLTMPGLAPGNYYSVIVADPSNTVIELSDFNNTHVSDVTFPTGPDFRIDTVVPSGIVSVGGTIVVDTTVGSAAIPYTGAIGYELFASTDATLDMGDTSLGTYSVSFTGQATILDSQTVTFPSMLAAGAYRVIALVDPAAQVLELNEMNNWRASTTPVTNAADFRVQLNTVAPLQVQPGDTLNLTGQFQSVGTPFTGMLSYRVYLSPDELWDAADTPIFDGQVFVPGLSTTAFDIDVPVAPRTPVGRYRVIVYADPNNAVPEAIETNNWGASNSAVDVSGPDLRVDSVSSSDYGFIGEPISVTVTLENTSPDINAFNFAFSINLSDNDVCNITRDPPLVDFATGLNWVQGATLAAGGAATYTVDMIIPATLTGTQSAWLCAFADVFSQISETSETNNVRRRPEPIQIRYPIPDLTGIILEASPSGAPGEEIAITRILSNDGVADSPSFDYRYYLSSNPTISTDDIAIGTYSSALLEGADDFAIDLVQIPSAVLPGTYYVGMILDPDGLVEETTASNNAAVGPQIQLYESTIRFTTNQLSNATIGVPYEAGVYAQGGPLGLSWSVSGGALPPGLSLDASQGIISGTPTEEGLFAFTLRASSGTAFATKEFSIRVTSPTVELQVATETLPTGVAGRNYDVEIVAVGGVRPYRWSVSGNPPADLHLSENGVLSGVPAAPGNYNLTVSLRDDLGTAASKRLALNIIGANQAVVINQLSLPTASIDRPYCGDGSNPVVFEATGGLPPYKWSMIDTSIPGMTLDQNGTFCGTPEQVGEFPLLVRAQDQTGLFDTSLFIFEVDEGDDLAITTPNLDDGVLGEAYGPVALTAIQGTSPYRWNIAQGSLPPGIELSEGGIVQGTPTDAGQFNFTVQVIDDKLRTDVQPLSILVPTGSSTTGDGGGCGCSNVETEGGTNMSSALALLAIGLLLLVGRRGPRLRLRPGMLFGAFLAAGLVASATDASAQLMPGTNYFRATRSVQYQDLSSPTVIFAAPLTSNEADVQLPFSFRFYDLDFDAVSISNTGVLTLGGGNTFISSFNSNLGSCCEANVLAPFWDDLELDAAFTGDLSYQVQGVAPRRRITFQWRDVQMDATSFSNPSLGELNFQVILHEGSSGRIQVRYGSSSIPPASTNPLTATMGMHDQAYGRAISFVDPSCSPSCNDAVFTANMGREVEIVQDPGIDLVAFDIVAPQYGYLGAESPVQVTLSNLHRNSVGPFKFKVVISPTTRLDPNTYSVAFESSNISFQPFQTETTFVQIDPPAGLAVGNYYLGLIVDSDDTINEVDENNNAIVSSNQIVLRPPAPDLEPTAVSLSATQVSAGGSIDVTSTVRNSGVLPASNVAVAIMLSTNPAISAQDAELGRFNVATLANGDNHNEVTTVQIPANLNSGVYYVGVLTDPDNQIEEISEANNGLAASQTLQAAGGNLAIVTSRLPQAPLRVPYVAQLQAVGGSGSYSWTVAQGTLPAGIGVDSTGQLYGRASVAGCEMITFEVDDGTNQAQANIQLCAVDPDEPLTVVSREVPVAVVGQEYGFSLIAVGGTATGTSGYTWTGTGFPTGLSVSAEGIIVGTAEQIGTSTASVMVQDEVGATASRNIAVRVVENAQLQIDAVQLPSATFGLTYQAQLTATGGLPPISWIVKSGSLPEGLSLATDGTLAGLPNQVGRFRFVVEARDAGSGATASRDENTFEIVVKDVEGFSIVTSELPLAVIGENYDFRVETAGGSAPINWKILEGRLPDGINDEPAPETGSLRLVGAPTTAGKVNLLFEATDGTGRKALASLALEVLAEKPAGVCDPALEVCGSGDDDGCSCSSSERGDRSPVLFGLLLIGFALVRRRRG